MPDIAGNQINEYDTGDRREKVEQPQAVSWMLSCSLHPSRKPSPDLIGATIPRSIRSRQRSWGAWRRGRKAEGYVEIHAEGHCGLEALNLGSGFAGKLQCEDKRHNLVTEEKRRRQVLWVSRRIRGLGRSPGQATALSRSGTSGYRQPITQMPRFQPPNAFQGKR